MGTTNTITETACRKNIGGYSSKRNETYMEKNLLFYLQLAHPHAGEQKHTQFSVKFIIFILKLQVAIYPSVTTTA